MKTKEYEVQEYGSSDLLVKIYEDTTGIMIDGIINVGKIFVSGLLYLESIDYYVAYVSDGIVEDYEGTYIVFNNVILENKDWVLIESVKGCYEVDESEWN